jgi:formylmethanofuran dehydrogenase subunit C
MQEQRPRRQGNEIPGSRLAASKSFDKYKKETKKKELKASVKESKALKQLKEAWKSCNVDYDTGIGAYDSLNRSYRRTCALVKELDYSPEDVKNFTIALSEFQDEDLICEKMGIFLSALINSGKDNQYTIVTSHLAHLPWYLGFLNTKKIKVEGKVGLGLGLVMSCGEIVVHGNAEAKIEGEYFDKEHAPGFEMKDGIIHIKGDVVGNPQVLGGKVIIEGNLTVYEKDDYRFAYQARLLRAGVFCEVWGEIIRG